MSMYPKTNEVFVLEFEENEIPEDLPHLFGYPAEGKWSHKGVVVPKGRHRAHFMVVHQGGSWEEISRALSGRIPPGQWIKAFKAKYSNPDGGGPVGIPDDSWVASSGENGFPCIANDGKLSFEGVEEYEFGKGWRWLVFAD